MAALIADLALTVLPLSEDLAYSAARGYKRWGKGHDPAGLKICDNFAYAPAMERRCPLLFASDDFAQTDVARAE